MQKKSALGCKKSIKCCISKSKNEKHGIWSLVFRLIKVMKLLKLQSYISDSHSKAKKTPKKNAPLPSRK